MRSEAVAWVMKNHSHDGTRVTLTGNTVHVVDWKCWEAEMSRAGTWSDELCIDAVVHMYSVTIQFVTDGSEVSPLTSSIASMAAPSNGISVGNLFLGCEMNLHFHSLINKD